MSRRVRVLLVGLLLVGPTLSWAEEAPAPAPAAPAPETEAPETPTAAHSAAELAVDQLVQLPLEDLMELKVYSASKHEQLISDSPSAITVITREQLENTACYDLPCVLRQVPEVDVREVMPMWASVGARALTSDFGDKALLILDGEALNTEAWGLPHWYVLPVQIEDIERIEVIRGPGSALYGANAHSLVISITTKKLAENYGEAYLGYGELGRMHAHGATGHAWEKWSVRLSGGYDAVNDWLDEDKLVREYGFARVRVDRTGESSRSLFIAGVDHAEGDTGSVMLVGSHTNTTNLHLFASHQSDHLQGHIGFGYAESGNALVIPPMKIMEQFGFLEEIPGNVDFTGANLDAGGQSLIRPIDSLLLIAGTDYKWVTLDSPDNSLEHHNQHNWGVYVQGEQQIGSALTLTATLRFDLNSITDETLSPRLAAIWRLAQDQVLRLSFGQAFRRPHLFNTSFHFTSFQLPAAAEVMHANDFLRRSVGNPNLRNESVTAVEGGYRGRFFADRLSAELNVFYNRYRDTITLYADTPPDLDFEYLDNSLVQYRNVGAEADSLGGSLALGFALKDLLRVDLNYTYRYTWYVNADGTMGYEEGDQVELDPAHLGNLTTTFFLPWGFRVSLNLHGRSESAAWVSSDFFGANVRRELDGLVLGNAFLAWKRSFGDRWVEAGLKVLNILDQHYRDWPTATWPGGQERGGSLIGRMLVGTVSGSF